MVIFFLAKNFIRRRKQVAFDRELQEATRQAAAVSAAPFDDDDDDPYTKRGVYGTADSYRDRQYSDMSHGTYGQNAMSVESYGMREIGHPPIPMAADVYSSDPYTAGAAGIGVARARSMRLDGQGSHSRQPDFSVALSEGNAPYAAFAAPNPGNMPGGSGDPYAATQNLELLDATGLGKHMAGAGSLARASSQIHYPHQMQQDGGYGGYPLPGLDRSRSMGVPAQYYPAGTVHPYATATPVNNMNRYSVVNEDMEDAYGGVDDGGPDPSANMHTPGTGRDIVAQREDYLPNPFESGSNDGHMRGDTESIGQEEPRRVLKVTCLFYLMWQISSFKRCFLSARSPTNRTHWPSVRKKKILIPLF